MVRKHKRKIGARKYSDYTPETLEQAVSDVRNGLLSIREAAFKYGLPKTTIGRKMLNQNTGVPGHPTVLNSTEETAIVKHLITVADWGFAMNFTDLRILAKLYLDRCGRKVLRFKNNMPGKDWARSFVRRHAGELTRRLCQNIKVARSKVDSDIVNKYFDNLAETVAGVPPGNLVNYDETNLSDDPGSTKYIFKRGARYPERVMNSTKSATSIMFAGSASGELLVPYVVYKAESMWETWREGGPPGCRYNRSKSGWFDAICFNDWFQTVIVPWARKRDGKKVIIGDNLSSHFTSSVLETCETLNIAFVCLPPNATHLMQPLDVAVYGPMKKAWREILTSWKENKGLTRATLPKDQFRSLLSDLLNKLKPNLQQNLVSGFRTCGIEPVDRQQVLKRLPGVSDDTEANASANVSESVLKMLSTMRYGDKEQVVLRTRRKVDVEPGKSVTARDYQDNPPARKSRVVAKRKRPVSAQSDSESASDATTSAPSRVNTRHKRPVEDVQAESASEPDDVGT